jgi:hypothetical protein
MFEEILERDEKSTIDTIWKKKQMVIDQEERNNVQENNEYEYEYPDDIFG